MGHTILLTGATGYVGGRLLRRLTREGHFVRCVARKPEYLAAKVQGTAEVVRGDVLDYPSLLTAMEGVRTAYYLVHSMGSSADFEELDKQAALNFGKAARTCNVQRIIYLGGLGDSSADLSPHLRSRQLVGQLLAQSGIPVIEFRASIVVGSGSLSFELVRALVERLPVMVTPRWVSIRAQPIAVTDILEYLCQALDVHVEGHQVFEIGGRDQVTYGDLMREYARQRGVRRLMIQVPVLTPRLSSLWLGLVTPLYARVGRKLIDSIRHPTIVRDHRAREVFHLQPKGMQEAITEAFRHEDLEFAETRWWDSMSSSGTGENIGGKRFGNRLVDQRRVTVSAPASSAFAVIQRLGGTNGWCFADWLWHLRGFLDVLVGGVGMRRGRRHPVELRVGDVVDWWRVERFDPGERLLLAAEMKLPGRAWLEFTVQDRGDHSVVVQTASFDPVGLAGLAYWFAIYPLHVIVFSGMVRGIAREISDQRGA